MARYITKDCVNVLVLSAFLLFLLGGIYVYTGCDISTIRLCKVGDSLDPDDLKMATPTTDILRNSSSSWEIRELKMPQGLKYAQPSTQQGRTDVNSVTNWNAPLVWEGTFDPVVIDAIYKRMDPRIAVVVFAVGKYIRFLQGFLESGEKYFLVDFRVTYYVFTDRQDEVPKIVLGKGRSISVVSIPSATRWQEVVLGRMKWATIAIDKQIPNVYTTRSEDGCQDDVLDPTDCIIRKEADYLFMMDIDSVFHNRFGAESLSRLSAVLHRGYYKNTHRDSFPYERRPESQAYIPAGEGDYYYTAAVWGGYLDDMYKLVRYCYEQSEVDTKNKVEAVWQEESHLNKYLLCNKPTKVLSPEYLWSDYTQLPADIRLIRISQLVKNYAEIRPNKGN